MDRVNPERACRDDIRLHVIDIDGAARIDCKAPDQQFEDARIGLDQPDLARDQNAAKPAQKFKALEGRGISFGREIGKAIKGRAPIAKLGQDLHRAGDRAGHHFIETGEIGIDQLGLLRMLGL